MKKIKMHIGHEDYTNSKDNLIKKFNTMKKENVIELYKIYLQRFIEDNSKIFSTGAILIPLSFAVFATVPTVISSFSSFVPIILPAAISLILYFAWFFIAENHRVFQNRNMLIISAIEKSLGIVFISGKKKEEINIDKIYDRGRSIQKIYAGKGGVRIIFIFVGILLLLLWLAIIFFYQPLTSLIIKATPSPSP